MQWLRKIFFDLLSLSLAEPFKVCLANLGSERVDEVFDPEKAVKRAVHYYKMRGYDDEWIKFRLTGIVDRNKLTDVWADNGIKEDYEFGILTNEIYQGWSGMKASEYKEFKGIRKESLRDNMSDLEILLTDIGEENLLKSIDLMAWRKIKKLRHQVVK